MKNSEFEILESQQNQIYNLKGQKFNKKEVNNNEEKAIIINNQSNILEIKDSTLDIELEDKKDDLFNYMNNQANLTLDIESEKDNENDEIDLVAKDNEEKKDYISNEENINKQNQVNQNKLNISNITLSNLNTNFENPTIRKINVYNNKIDNTILKLNENLESEINSINDDSFIFDGKIFKKSNNYSKYTKKNNIKRDIYKCKYNRHEEKFRKEMKLKSFCNATIEYVYPNQNTKSGYFLKEDHSQECEKAFPTIKKNDFNPDEKKEENNNQKEKFIKACNNIMNSSTIYDRNIYKDKFKDIYNKENYNFPIDNNFLSNIITKWRNNSNRFTKLSVWDNIYDFDNRLILKEFRSIFDSSEQNKSPKQYEFIIWANDENIKRLGKSNHYYIDCTFHHPKEYNQLLIIMYKDIITEKKYQECIYY